MTTALPTPNKNRILLVEDHPLYRVLVGSFLTAAEAERFLEESGMRKLFSKLWLNVVDVNSA